MKNKNIIRLRSRIKESHPRNNQCYYVWGVLSNGKRFILGGFSSDMEAEQAVMQKQGVMSYDVKCLPTSDIGTAVRLCKAEDINKLENVEHALERVDRKGVDNG